MCEPPRDGIVVVGADDGGGVPGELGNGAGYRVRFVGHTEHADVVDFVAEHDQSTVLETLQPLDAGYTLILGGASVVDRQPVPAGGVVILEAVDADRRSMTTVDLAFPAP